jgi:hypothetical protein
MRPLPRLISLGVRSLSLALGATISAHAEVDAGCVQRMLAEQSQKVQLCRDKFAGEHRELCEAAAQQEHQRKVKVCAFRERVPAPGPQ